MIAFTQKDETLMEQYCGAEYLQRFRGIMSRKKDKVVRIVNTGMVSSGKSSLFNALINSEEEYFQTGAARTTTKADYFDCNNISYIDTPGIDVRDEDDDMAFRTVMEADLIMMVHNIRTGPLNRSEVEWLERIASGMNSIGMRTSRILFVITWKDTREKDEDYDSIVSDVKRMVFDVIGAEIPCFEVSVKKYQNGVAKGKDALIANSGVQELKTFLEQYADQYLELKKKMDNEELQKLLTEMKSILQKTQRDKEEGISVIQTKVRNRHKSVRSAWVQVYEYFSGQRNRLTSLLDELDSI